MADETPNPDTKKSGGGLQMLVQAESMVQIAVVLPAGCLIGWGVGTLLDHHFRQDWMVVAGIVLGAIGGFIQIFRMASTYLNRK